MNTSNNKVKRIIKTGVMAVSLLVVGACSAHSVQHKAPHHRPAVKVMYNYDYFPEQHVYYDRHNRLYHYHHIDLGWLAVRVLPKFIHLNHHKRHNLSYNHNRPWRERHAYKHHYSHSQPKYVNRHGERSHRKYYNTHKEERREHHQNKHNEGAYKRRSRH